MMKFLTPYSITLPIGNCLVLEDYDTSFICDYCKGKHNCPLTTDISISDSKELNNTFLDATLCLLNKTNSQFAGIIFLVTETNLVENRKILYDFSKTIFTQHKEIYQLLFTNVEFFDFLKLKPAYKYFTYIDYLIQKRNIDFENSQSKFDCIFKNSTCIDITNSFSNGKIIYKNF